MQKRKHSYLFGFASRSVHILSVLTLIFYSFTTTSIASPEQNKHYFCPDKTQTYYEQIYCEILNTSHAGKLPSARDFRRNTPDIQKLILKPLARSTGVAFDPTLFKGPLFKGQPLIKHGENKLHHIPDERPEKLPPYKHRFVEKKPASSCQLMFNVTQNNAIQNNAIQCSNNTQYLLAHNEENSNIRKGALDERNLMGLDDYHGNINNKLELSQFMTKQYERYLEKMLDIGLGGTTLSYDKFVDIFYITHRSGKRFSYRFETMYTLLKKDKGNMRIRKDSTLDRQLTIKACQQISDRLFTCSTPSKNSVFVKIK